MEQTRIQPALAPEEWHAALRDRAGFAAAMQLAWGTEQVRENDHALAALALWNQPFGFTRDDVALLERCEACVGWKHEEAVRALTAKVRALLPPE